MIKKDPEINYNSLKDTTEETNDALIKEAKNHLFKIKELNLMLCQKIYESNRFLDSYQII